jgi:transcription-repair coupling factor (superfamily II helicase)
VSELVPEAGVAVAHGQMAEEQLERVMLEFAAGDIDVLVATTIIESGLDIPNVNTLIVNDADRLGLAQLYQLRGRVGRSSNRAYAYFLYGRGKRLTHQAQRRLQTIFEATELGAGFRIAMRDLEIRGAGNLLGVEQSGHIGAVGFDLYCRMLREEVESLKSEGRQLVAYQQPPTIDLPLKAYIPAGYIDDLDMRLSVYQRLAELVNGGQVSEMAKELEDRFGEAPPAVNNLLYAIRVKLLAMDAGVESVATEGGQLILRMATGYKLDKELAGSWSFEGVKAGTNQVRLDMRKLGRKWQKTLEDMLQSLVV